MGIGHDRGGEKKLQEIGAHWARPANPAETAAAQDNGDFTVEVPATEEDLANEVEVWEEHWPVFDLFLTMGTQWRVGPNGPTGLDYSVLPALLEILEIPPPERRKTLRDLQIIEVAALEGMAERRKR